MQTLVIIAVVLAEILVVAPILVFLRLGRTTRRDEILSYFSPGAVAQYFSEFWKSQDVYRNLADAWLGQKLSPEAVEATRKKLLAEFRALYDRQFGLRLYIYPLVLLFLIVAVQGFFALQSGIGEARLLAGGHQRLLWHLKFDPVVIAALAGAYLWVVSDAIYRAHIKDLGPSDVYSNCLRLLIAAPMGKAISSVAATTGAAPFVAFAIGAFPLAQINDILRALTLRSLSIQDQPQEVGDKLINLQGVDTTIANRVAAEGVLTIKQLVCADPVQLCMRTHFEFELIIDLVNQGIAWNYLGSKLLQLHAYGLIGAADFIDLYDRSDPSVSLEMQALAYAQAKRAADTATIAAAADPTNASLQQAKDEASKALMVATEALLSAGLDNSTIELLKAITGNTDIKLDAQQLRSTISKIGTDNYARFVYKMLRDSLRPLNA
jgi:hypothetical protein